MTKTHEYKLYPALIISIAFALVPLGQASAQREHGAQNRLEIEKMRDEELQPERILNLIGIRQGMVIGEAGAGHGYFTFKLSRRVGDSGRVYANDIDTDVLRFIEDKCREESIMNITTVLGKLDDPQFPKDDLDMVCVFDCLFEFSQPVEWMRNTKVYLKPDAYLVIVEPNRGKFPSANHFLSREEIMVMAAEAGFVQAKEVDDSYLKRHMILLLEPKKES